MAGEKLIREAIEAARAAMARGALPPAENSRLTQIATTGPSYDKALRHLERAGIEGRAIDYGAGRGHGLRSIGADTFEPYPQGWTPTFTKPEDIPDDVYRRLVNLNVLNVLDPEARQSAVLNMGRVVEPGGGGVISTRGRDVMAARGEPGPEPMSLIIGEGDNARYQKGFTPRELREYVGDTLGPRFDVEPSDVGAASIMFRRNREDGGPVEERDGFQGGGVIRRAIEAARKAVAPEDLLMGIHNTAEGRRLDMIERLGGLPAPSIAITKPSQGYTSFGDISLVAPVEMVTPGRKTPVFGSDVYSPRFPSVEDDQIFRGFTPAGNRRYAPLTMENVLREMKGNVRGGENFNYGPASIRAQVTPQFGSLPEMQAAREKIIPSNEFGAQKDMSTEMMERLRERFEPYFKPTDPYRRSWSAFPEVLTDYARTGRPSEFAYDYKDLPAEALTDARSFLSHLRDMPTEYFEAKPQRAVPLSEFSGAVVPADVPGSVVDRIRNMGINRIEEYGDDASRAAALMRFVGEQGFADGGEVNSQTTLNNDAAFLDMGRVFPPAPAGKIPNRAEDIPLTRSFGPAQPEVVDRALEVVRSEPRPMDIRVSRQSPPPPRPVPRPAPVRAPARAPAAPDTSESRRLWEIYNETGNPADFVRASNAMRAGRAEGGRLLEDQYPTHYLPNVGRQVMADGGGAMDPPLTTPDQRLDVIDTYLEDAVDQSLNRGPVMQFDRLPAPSEPHTTPNERIGTLLTYGGDVSDQSRYRNAVPAPQPAVDPNRQSYLEAFGPPQTGAGLTPNAPAALAPGEYGRQKLDRIMTGIFGPNARERAVSAAQSLFAPPDPNLPPGEYGRRRLDTLINNLVDPALLGSKATLGVEDIRGGVVLPDRAGVPPAPRDYGTLPSSQSFQSTVAPPAQTPVAKTTEVRGPYGQFSDADVEALANMIAGEASTQGREGMAQVGQVALNRVLMNYNDYGNTLQAQLSRPRQFLGYNSPNAKAIMAGETPQQQAIAQQAREIARGLIEGTIQPKFANATDFNRGSTSFNAKRGAANAARLGSHTFFNASPAYARRLERARRERQGRATGGIVDDALGVVRELPQQDPVRVAMFAGEGAVGAPLQSLDLAKRLIAEGASPEEAYRGSASDGSTGWFQGADGRWRFEVSDKDATINPESFERLRAGNPVRPSELLSHPRLFEMYPNLNKINLGMVPQSEYDQGLMGSFNNRTNTLSLPPDLKQAQSTMLHELQHGIQNSENFGTGGGSTAIKEALKSEILLEQMRASRRAMEMRKQVMDRMFDTNYADPEQLSKFREFQAENERQIASEQGRIPALKQRFEELNPTGRWGSLKDYELYRRLAGETEARNVQNRMQMDLDERRASFPGTTQEYPNEEQYVRMRGERADGGEVESAMDVVRSLPTEQSRRRATLDQLGSFEDRPVMDPATMGQNWASAVRRFRENPVRPGEATVRPLELGGRDVLGGAIAGDGGIVRSRIADIVAGSRGLPGNGTLGMGVADLTPAGIPLAVSDFSDALRNEDYLSAGLTAGLPAAYFARKPIMAAGRAVYDAGARAVGAARDVLGRVPAPVAAGGAGAAVMTPEEAEAVVPVSAARQLLTRLSLPKSDVFEAAVRNTPSAQLTDEGLLMSIIRGQRSEQAGQPSTRGGVFYLPEGSKDARHYRGGVGTFYGGSTPVSGETMIANPLFVKGATGGKAPQAAYDELMGKKAYDSMRAEALSSMPPYYLKEPELREEMINRFLEKYAPSMIGQEGNILRNSTKGNQLAYALQESAVGDAVRRAGYDSVLGYSTSRSTKQPFISELFDVRERSYPTSSGGYDIWPEYLSPADRATDLAREIALSPRKAEVP